MRRVLLTPDTLRVSLPGVDVFNPPSLTSKHLAIDSSWARAERLVTLATVINSNLASDVNVFFDVQDTPPLATFIRSNGATIFDDTMLFTGERDLFASSDFFISRSRRNLVTMSRDFNSADGGSYNFNVLVFRDGDPGASRVL